MLNYSVHYMDASQLDNIPSGYSEGIGIDVKRVEEGIRFQIFLFRGGSSGRGLFFRHSWSVDPAWSAWKEIA